MRHVNKPEQYAYMRARQRQNRVRVIAAEEWAWPRIKAAGGKWERQAIWGCRLFDFFSIGRGIAVEIDGPEHIPAYDLARDQYNYFRSGIVVLRVKNFNETDLAVALAEIRKGETRKERRKRVRRELGLREDAAMKDAVKAAGLKLAHCNWEPAPI